MDFKSLLVDIHSIDKAAQKTAGRSVDRVLTLRNWLIGACIVEFEQNGEDRAQYGDRLFKRLAEKLQEAGGRGLGARALKNYRQLALTWPALEIRHTVCAVFGEPYPEADLTTPTSALGGLMEMEAFDPQQSGEWSFPSLKARHTSVPGLPWYNQAWFERLFLSVSYSHLLELSRIDDPTKRAFYELECLKSRWSVRELKRQRDSLLYERVGLSKDKDAVMALSEQGHIIDTPHTLIRDPYVLEFLGLEQRTAWSESELEQALINHLQQFIHELGRDYCFVERQFRITVGGRHHFIDLLFYHRALRCLIAIDLKLDAFKHEDAGQMHFYLNYLADQVAHPDENPPVGLILCADKDEAEVHYATAGLAQSLFVSRYLVKLPSEEQLKRWLQQERSVLLAHVHEPKDDSAV